MSMVGGCRGLDLLGVAPQPEPARPQRFRQRTHVDRSTLDDPRALVHDGRCAQALAPEKSLAANAVTRSKAPFGGGCSGCRTGCTAAILATSFAGMIDEAARRRPLPEAASSRSASTVSLAVGRAPPAGVAPGRPRSPSNARAGPGPRSRRCSPPRSASPSACSGLTWAAAGGSSVTVTDQGWLPHHRDAEVGELGPHTAHPEQRPLPCLPPPPTRAFTISVVHW